MIFIKSIKEIETMREAGKILAEVLGLIKSKIKPGVTGDEIDELAETVIKKYNAIPGFKGLYDFPATVCFSINNEIVHGSPYGKKLKEGDIISIDCGVLYNNYYSDAAFSIGVGDISSRSKKLIKDTEKALEIGIENSISGKNFGDISYSIQKYGKKNKYGIVKELSGHGIGKKLHEQPDILNIGKKGTGEKIREGMVFCLEPMLTLGDWKIKKGKDGYAWETLDGSLSAHFEHMIVITKNGPEILTKL